MPSSPVLQPQRGTRGMIFSSLLMLNSCVTELVDKAVVEDETSPRAVVTPGDDVDKLCNVQLPVDIAVRSSTDSESTEISEKSRFGNRRELRPENRREFRLVSCGGGTGPGSRPRVLVRVPVPSVVGSLEGSGRGRPGLT